jgi:cytochrome c oxidase cbb3-type subunit I
MNQNAHNPSAVDASCRVPLLAIFGGAVLWLIVGLVLAIMASLTFHMPEMFAKCPYLTYGRILPAANDLIVYGFAIPAALGVMLWIFARLSDSELVLPIVVVAASNIWHLGVFIGTAAILIGDSTGFTWLEYPRAAAILIFTAFLLMATSAVATFGARRDRTVQPAHWFLLAALLWFAWIYSTANMFLLAWTVRGVAQSVIDWWYSNNLLFVWMGLAGLGIAFYMLPKIAGRPLQKQYFALFAFWTFIFFASWCGMPQTAPIPAWLPAASTVASALLILPLIGFWATFVNTVCGAKVNCKGGPFCYVKFGTTAFLLSILLMIITGCCPHIGRVLGLTWFGPAVVQLLIFGFFAIVICGAIYELLPSVMDLELPFPGFVRFQHWFFMAGSIVLFLSLAIAGVEQGIKMQNPNIAFTDVMQATLTPLRFAALGLACLLVGSLMLAANFLVMTIKWHCALVKCVATAIQAPLETDEVKS